MSLNKRLSNRLSNKIVISSVFYVSTQLRILSIRLHLLEKQLLNTHLIKLTIFALLVVIQLCKTKKRLILRNVTSSIKLPLPNVKEWKIL